MSAGRCSVCDASSDAPMRVRGVHVCGEPCARVVEVYAECHDRKQYRRSVRRESDRIRSRMSTSRKRAVRRRDGVCVLCGAEEELTVHHVRGLRVPDPHGLWNLVVLCSGCHQAVERGRESWVSLFAEYIAGVEKNPLTDPSGSVQDDVHDVSPDSREVPVQATVEPWDAGCLL